MALCAHWLGLEKLPSFWNIVYPAVAQRWGCLGCRVPGLVFNVCQACNSVANGATYAPIYSCTGTVQPRLAPHRSRVLQHVTCKCGDRVRLPLPNNITLPNASGQGSPLPRAQCGFPDRGRDHRY